MATGRYPDRHEAMKDSMPGGVGSRCGSGAAPPMRPTAARPVPGGNAEQQLNAMAKQIAAARHITFAQAYVQALMENPQLYTAYLGQPARQTP